MKEELEMEILLLSGSCMMSLTEYSGNILDMTS